MAPPDSSAVASWGPRTSDKSTEQPSRSPTVCRALIMEVKKAGLIGGPASMPAFLMESRTRDSFIKTGSSRICFAESADDINWI